MLVTLGSIAALLLGAFIMLLGNSLLTLALPLKMSDAGFATEITGVIMAAYFAGLLTGALYGKRVIGEVGHIRAFAGFAAMMAAATLAYPMQVSEIAWCALRFIGGFCVAGLFAVLESWMNERASNELRGRVLSIYMVNNYLGIMLGQLMINLWDIDTLEVFMMAALLISLCLVPIVLTKVRAPNIAHIRPLSLVALYRSSPLGVVGSMASGAVLGAYYGMGAIFAQQIGLSVFQISLFMGAFILGAMTLQWPVGRLSDRYDRRLVLLGILSVVLIACAAGFGTSFLREPFHLLLGIGVLLGGAMMSIYPIAVSQVYDHVEPDRYVAASSGLLLTYSLGAIAGPIVAGFAMAQLGPFAFFLFIAAVAGLLAAFGLYRVKSREPLPAEERKAFVALPRMSPVASELDPRLAPGAAPDVKAPSAVAKTTPAAQPE